MEGGDGGRREAKERGGGEKGDMEESNDNSQQKIMLPKTSHFLSTQWISYYLQLHMESKQITSYTQEKREEKGEERWIDGQTFPNNFNSSCTKIPSTWLTFDQSKPTPTSLL